MRKYLKVEYFLSLSQYFGKFATEMFCFCPLKSFGKVSKILAQVKKVVSLEISPHLLVAQKYLKPTNASH